MMFSPGLLRPLYLASALVAGCSEVPLDDVSQAPDPGKSRYFVDCGATAPGEGSELRPWNGLSAVNAHLFEAGESVLFKRGTTCEGILTPRGSGVPGAPVVLDSYGEGTQPVIDGGDAEYAIKLANQSYWKLRNIETSGGTRYGIFVTVNAGTAEHIYLENVVVRDVYGTPPDSKNTGLVVISPTHDEGNSTAARFNDVVLNNVTAHNTNQWAGILVGTGTAADGWASNEKLRSSNVAVRNSRVHDVYGDGIVLFAVNEGLIERSVAYRTGLEPTQTIGTPNAIWTWSCTNCTVQYNEAFDNRSPGVDGGAFDIDWGSTNTIVQYNYGHHNAAYCIAIFGAAGLTTTNSIVRYNICAFNGVEADRQNKEIEITTWDGGTIDGLQIYNNTIITRHGAFNSDFYSGGFTGDLPRFFKNNIVYAVTATESGAGPLFEEIEGLERDHNLYVVPGGDWSSGEANSVQTGPQVGLFVGHIGTGGPERIALQRGSPAIDAGVDVCAGVENCDMGGADFFGTETPQRAGYDIGAFEAVASAKDAKE